MLGILFLAVFPFCFGHQQQGKRSDPPDCYNAKESHDVIIVGAGISGLVAGTELYWNFGVKDVVILEARDRIGGRIFTQRAQDKTYIEIGAQYVHGETGNVAYQFADRYGLVVAKRDKPRGDDVWYNLNGQEVDYKTVVKPAQNGYDESRDLVTVRKKNESVGFQLKKNFAIWLAKNSRNSQAKQAVFNFLYNDECTETSDELMKLSAEEDDVYLDAKGDEEGYIKNGWTSVVEKLTENFPIERLLRFRAVASKINYGLICNGEKRVAVTLSNGEVYLAKSAIVTLPLGVLKAGTVEFQPALPPAKQTAIRSLGFGCAAKMFLFFDLAWWGKDVLEVNALFIDGVDDGIKVNRALYDSDRESLWYRQLVAFNTVFGHPLVLQAWLTGEWAKISERLPLEEVASVLNQILFKAFEEDFPTLRYATRVLKSDWCSDPYAAGAYSYVEMGSEAKDYEALAAPLPEGRGDKVLFFAGEATSKRQWASVHGAWTTGSNAAEDVADLLFRK